jgi:hypothetical protein
MRLRSRRRIHKLFYPRGYMPKTENVEERIFKLARMEKNMQHPGALNVIKLLFYRFGTHDLTKLEDLKYSYLQTWALYKRAHYNIQEMHETLNAL